MEQQVLVRRGNKFSQENRENGVWQMPEICLHIFMNVGKIFNLSSSREVWTFTSLFHRVLERTSKIGYLGFMLHGVL